MMSRRYAICRWSTELRVWRESRWRVRHSTATPAPHSAAVAPSIWPGDVLFWAVADSLILNFLTQSPTDFWCPIFTLASVGLKRLVLPFFVRLVVQTFIPGHCLRSRRTCLPLPYYQTRLRASCFITCPLATNCYHAHFWKT